MHNNTPLSIAVSVIAFFATIAFLIYRERAKVAYRSKLDLDLTKDVEEGFALGVKIAQDEDRTGKALLYSSACGLLVTSSMAFYRAVIAGYDHERARIAQANQMESEQMKNNS